MEKTRIEIGPRSEGHEMPTMREGWGTSFTYSRMINGHLYSFTRITMPNGERRYAVSVYNGYGSCGNRRVIDPTKFGCAWTTVHFITVRPMSTEIWYGWRNGHIVRTYQSRHEAERELMKRLVQAISPKDQ